MNLKKILKIFFQISFLILLLFSFYSFHLSSKNISTKATVENIGLENPILGIYNDGNYVYVTNTDRHEIIKLDNNLNVFARVGSFGFGGNDQFAYPSGITGDRTFLYITDTENNRIVKRRADDLSYVGEATGLGFNNPRGIYFDPNRNEVFVTDTDNHRIVVLDTNLRYLREVGSFGFGGNDQFAYPSGITGDRTFLYITDTENNRIVKRRADDLSYVGEATGLGFNNPRGIYFDPNRNEVFVTDTDNHRIVVLDTNLRYLREVGSFGFGGNDQFAYPSGITGGMINGRDIIFVLNTENNSIDVRDASTLQSVALGQQGQ